MSLKKLRTVSEIREHFLPIRRNGEIIGLVPTMGALHRGHGILIEKARAECAHVAVSIFVNPLQFGPAEDFARYPRAFEADRALCEQKGADIIFAPEMEDMYPKPQLTFAEVTRVSDALCGPFRPGHFRGVATVVLKLLNIVQPDRAYFGEKDFQQLSVIRRMVDDLNLPVQVVAVPTVRESDGLALSSRNAYLTADERKAAPLLFEALQSASATVENGETDANAVKQRALEILERDPRVQLEYFEIVDPGTVQPVRTINGAVRIAAAIWLGRTRLIDNVAAGSLKSLK